MSVEAEESQPHRAARRHSRPSVLVTGATGFLGRYAVRRLTADGYAVIGLGRSLPAPGSVATDYRYLPIDLGDSRCVDSVVAAAREGVDAVVHLAAVFPSSLQSPDADECGNRNLRVDGHVLEVCERLRCPLVFASSASVYATHLAVAIGEDGPIDGDRPYAGEKLVTEREGLRRLSSGGSWFAALRITAPYGAGQSIRTVVRIFVDQALKDEPLRYHGTGAREQDFVHAADVADAIAQTIRSRASGVFNIGSGSPTTMKELAALVVRSVPGCRSIVEPSGRPDPQESRFARFTIDRAASELRWHPRLALADGIAEWGHALRTDSKHANRVPV